tara:strand:- start:17 stop:421 length:405 start_codon:yes stop_codon:yes gene_type:complete
VEPLVENCHCPLELLTDVTATSCTRSLVGKPDALGCSSSVTEFASSKVDTASPTLDAFDISSSIVVKLLFAVKVVPLPERIEDPPLTRTGAAFIGLTFNSITSVPELNSEVPPFVDVSTLVPAVNVDVPDVVVL